MESINIPPDMVSSLAALGGGLLIALLGVVWSQLNSKLTGVNERLRTLGHEDRDIRAQMHGIMTLLTEHLSDEGKMQLKSENDRLKWVLSELKRDSK